MSPTPSPAAPALPAAPFSDPEVTAAGAPRAVSAPLRLQTLWVNTGTLCNIECAHCYIESSPANDRLAFLTRAEVAPVLAEAQALGHPLREVGLTGGEPFLNPHAPDIAAAALEADLDCLILTNAMRPMLRPAPREALRRLIARHGDRLTLRVSLDHPEAEAHDRERGEGAFARTLEGLRWLSEAGARIAVAGRLWDAPEDVLRDAFARLFAREGLGIDAHDPAACVLFPEMDETAPTPEITTDCWRILGKRPEEVMCSTSRMLVRRRGAAAPTLTACTLLPYDARFDLGSSLAEAEGPIPLNHRHCAKFCVLGGASCSG